MLSALVALGLAQSLGLTTSGLPTFTTGPTITALQLRPAFAEPLFVAPGVGWQLTANWFDVDLRGDDVYLLGLGALVFANELSSPQISAPGAVGLGVVACSLNLLCAGVGIDLAGSFGGVFESFSASRNVYPIFGVNISLEGSGAPSDSSAAAIAPKHRAFSLRVPFPW